jgi:uncharacterized damage-inducible protein DinB
MPASRWRKLILVRLHASRAELLEAAAGLTEENVSARPLWDDWTLRGLLSHIAACEAFEANRIRLAADGRLDELPTFSIEEQNARWHAQFADIPLHTAVAMLQKERNGLLNVLQQVSDTQLQAAVALPEGREEPLRWLENCIEHDYEHVLDIKAWRANNGLTKMQDGPQAIILAWLRTGLKYIQAAAELIPAAERGTHPVSEGWTLRELVAHLAGWEQFALAGLQQLQSPTLTSIQAFNEQSVAERAEQTFDEVWKEYVTTRRALIDHAIRMSQSDLEQTLINPWGWQRTPYTWLLIWPHHDMEHARHIYDTVQAM